MPTEETVIQNLKNCPRFDGCSANICALDPGAGEKSYIPGEDICAFMVKKRNKGQKGIKTQAPPHVLKVIVKPNIEMLNKRNQKRLHDLQKDGKK